MSLTPFLMRAIATAFCSCFIVLIFIFTICYINLVPSPQKTVDVQSKIQAAAQDSMRSETLHDLYKVEWQVNRTDQTIQFWLTVKTTGYIGFGLSTSGSMVGADMVIGGVFGNGTKYFKAYHGGTRNGMPTMAHDSDWEAVSIMESKGVTQLRLKRKLDTCDPQDIRITEGTLRMIWAIGATDDVQYHGTVRGTKSVNLLTHPTPLKNFTSLDQFHITQKIPMPSSTRTLYWCSIQKRPAATKSHIVAFKPKMDTPEAIKYTHHFDVFRCKAEPGENSDEVFGPFVGGPGENCLEPPAEGGLNSVRRRCFLNMYAWSMGGRLTNFPDDVGLPWGNDLGENEYFWLEIHLDNQDMQEMQVETGLTVFHTPILRPKEAGLLSIGMLTEPALMIPPDTTNWTLAGHCSPACTSKGLTSDGITIFAMNLHAHVSARKMKLRHFRGEKELPWAAKDDSYDFDFQEYRSLAQPLKVLPGDQFTFECTYDSTWKLNKPGSVVGGLASTDEMCMAFAFYYPVSQLERCFSSYPNPKLLNRFGITDFAAPDAATFEGGDPFIIEPKKWENRTFSDILSHEIKWTDEMKSELKEELRFGAHFDFCHTKSEDWKQNQDNFGWYNTPKNSTHKIHKQPLPSSLPPPGQVQYPKLVENGQYREIRECPVDKREPQINYKVEKNVFEPEKILNL